MKNILSVAAVVFILLGCAAPNVANDFDLRKTKNTGVVIGSITYEGVYGAYILHVESVADQKRHRIEHGSSQTWNPVLAFKGETVNPKLGKRGSVFAVELPAGEYRVTGWQIGVGGFNVSSTSSTGLAFNVAPKTAIYLGNFDFRVTDTFMRNPTKATVRLSDERLRDIALLKESFPMFAEVPLETAIADQLVIEGIGGSSKGSSQLPIFIPLRR